MPMLCTLMTQRCAPRHHALQLSMQPLLRGQFCSVTAAPVSPWALLRFLHTHGKRQGVGAVRAARAGTAAAGQSGSRQLPARHTGKHMPTRLHETYLATNAAGARGPVLPSPLCVSCRFRMKTMLSWSSPCCPAPAVGPRAEHQRQLVCMVQVPAWRLEAPVASIHCAGPSSFLTPTAAQLTFQSLLQEIGHEYSCLSVQQASLQASCHSPIFWRTSARR